MVGMCKDGLYNTSLLISPKGDIAEDTSVARALRGGIGGLPGREFPVYEIPGLGKVGIMIYSMDISPRWQERCPGKEPS